MENSSDTRPTSPPDESAPANSEGGAASPEDFKVAAIDAWATKAREAELRAHRAEERYTKLLTRFSHTVTTIAELEKQANAKAGSRRMSLMSLDSLKSPGSKREQVKVHLTRLKRRLSVSATVGNFSRDSVMRGLFTAAADSKRDSAGPRPASAVESDEPSPLLDDNANGEVLEEADTPTIGNLAGSATDLGMTIAESGLGQTFVSETDDSDILDDDTETVVDKETENYIANSYMSARDYIVEEDADDMLNEQDAQTPHTHDIMEAFDRWIIKKKADLNMGDRKTGSAMNWNQLFQAAMRSKNYDKLDQVAEDFIAEVETYGRVIISEHQLPDAKKRTIPIASRFGGTAGGDKYCIQGILFKLVTDPKISRNGKPYYVYGGEYSNYAFAMKNASHDLMGAECYLKASERAALRGYDLCVPMQVVVDYWGYRAIAMPLLELDRQVYGGGADFIYDGAKHDTVRAVMSETSKELHLAPHRVLGKVLCCAGDVEVHQGRDGRLYTLDLARTVPPESQKVVRSIEGHIKARGQPEFYCLLRAELIERWKSRGGPPLSPDAYTAFSNSDPERKRHNRNIDDATTFLFKEAIPELAAELDALSPDEIETFEEDFSKRLHRSGVNIRHTGYLLSLCKNRRVQRVLFVQIVTRTLKSLLRSYLRKTLEESNEFPSEYLQKCTVVKLLNSTIHDTKSFWEHVVYPQLVKSFGWLALRFLPEPYRSDPAEQIFSYITTCDGMMLTVIVTMLLDTTGFRLRPDTRADFVRQGSDLSMFKFHTLDLLDSTIKIKTLSILQFAAAKVLSDSCSRVMIEMVKSRVEGSLSPAVARKMQTKQAMRLLTQSVSKCEELLRRRPRHVKANLEKYIASARIDNLNQRHHASQNVLHDAQRFFRVNYGDSSRAIQADIWSRLALHSAIRGAHSVQDINRIKQRQNFSSKLAPAVRQVDRLLLELSPRHFSDRARVDAAMGASHPASYIISQHTRFPLHDAASLGASGVVRHLLEAGEPQGVDAKGRTPLHMTNTVGIARALIAAEADPNQRDSSGLRPLEVVRNVDVARLLIQAKAEVGGRATISTAAREGRLGVVVALLDRKADPMERDSETEMTAMHFAALGNHLSIVQLLLDLRVNPNHSSEGRSSLHYACSRGHVPVVRLLLSRGADPSLKTNSGWTPFRFSQCIQVKRTLAHQLRLIGKLSLVEAAAVGWEDEVRKLVERNSSGPNERDQFGQAALHYAIGSSQVGVVKQLLNMRADANLSSSYGVVPLEMTENLDIARTLIKHKATVTDNDRWTPTRAVNERKVGVLLALLEMKADPTLATGMTDPTMAEDDDDIDGNGGTGALSGLTLAAHRGKLDMVEAIVEHRRSSAWLTPAKVNEAIQRARDERKGDWEAVVKLLSTRLDRLEQRRRERKELAGQFSSSQLAITPTSTSQRMERRLTPVWWGFTVKEKESDSSGGASTTRDDDSPRTGSSRSSRQIAGEGSHQTSFLVTDPGDTRDRHTT